MGHRLKFAKFVMLVFKKIKIMLSDSEITTLRNNIIAVKDTVYNGKTIKTWLGESNRAEVAAYYNSAGSNDIWRPDLTPEEMTSIINMANFISLPAGNRDAWMAMSKLSKIDATQALVRTNFVSIFGSGTATTVSATALAQRKATNFEFLFTTSSVSTKYGYIVKEDDIYQSTLNIPL